MGRAGRESLAGAGSYWPWASGLFVLHAILMLVQYGRLPSAPVFGDEIIVNDAAIALGRGYGLRATSFVDSSFGIDKLFAHFPPLYLLIESLAFRFFGVSVYSLRLTTTLMSLAASLVVLLLGYDLYRNELLSRKAALLAGAVYCTCGPLIITERMARMESTISAITMTTFALAVKSYYAKDKRSRTLLLLSSGVFAGLTIAVHPEAVTVLLFMAPVVALSFGTHWEKLLSGMLAALTPILVWVVVFRSQSMEALRQFRSITGVVPKEEKLLSWLVHSVHSMKPFTLTHMYILGLVALLCFVLLLGYVDKVRGLTAASVQYRLGLGLAVAALFELAAMQMLFGMLDRRYQFLVGPLVIAVALVAFAAKPIKRGASRVIYGVIAVQLLTVAVYFQQGGGRPARTNPNRFDEIVQTIDPNARVFAANETWLAFQKLNRPITLNYGGFDGRWTWMSKADNPLDQFDVVIVDDGPSGPDKWVHQYLDSKWKGVAYPMDNEVFTVFTRVKPVGTALAAESSQ